MPAGGSERDDRGGNGAKSEMKWTRLAVCFILSCKYESRWKEWRSLCLLNYFYCSEKKNKGKKIKNGLWCLMLLFSPSFSLALFFCVFFSEKDQGSFLTRRLIRRRIRDWIDRLEWPSDSVSRRRGGGKKKKNSTRVWVGAVVTLD